MLQAARNFSTKSKAMEAVTREGLADIPHDLESRFNGRKALWTYEFRPENWEQQERVRAAGFQIQIGAKYYGDPACKS